MSTDAPEIETADEEETFCNFEATYDLQDNKLRLRSLVRFDDATKSRIKAAGFRWAPSQELWVAPAWTPEREDLCIELAGSIDDEDTTLAERAEAREERRDGYRRNRERDANRYMSAAESIASGIPMGQPILVGHHSERHARRHARQIESNTRNAVDHWRRREYWLRRAGESRNAARYKERPDVRARRIKGLEKDERKSLKDILENQRLLALWEKVNSLEIARRVAGCSYVYVAPAENGRTFGWTAYDVLSENRYSACPEMPWEEVRERAMKSIQQIIDRQQRWLEHEQNRLAFERAMLEESGGTKADQVKPEKGGAVRCWASPGYGKAWAIIQKVNKVSVSILDTWSGEEQTFSRTIPFDKLSGIMPASQVDELRAAGRIAMIGIRGFLVKGAPEPETIEEIIPEAAPTPEPEAPQVDIGERIEAIQNRISEGLTDVVRVDAVDFWPTPDLLAEQVADMADLKPGQRILEPSAGDGQLAKQCPQDSDIVCVEMHNRLANLLESLGYDTHHRDFMTVTPAEIGTFDRVIMNPPFGNAADIKHICHAATFLKPGGKLVAICAAGPRQTAAFSGKEGFTFEPLPDGSFESLGTKVRTAIVTYEAPEPVKVTRPEPIKGQRSLFDED